jgi:hypothetical protein
MQLALSYIIWITPPVLEIRIVDFLHVLKGLWGVVPLFLILLPIVRRYYQYNQARKVSIKSIPTLRPLDIMPRVTNRV